MNQKTVTPHTIGIDARFFRSDTAGIGRYSRELIHHLAELDHQTQYVIFLTEKDMPEWVLTQDNFRTVVVPAEHYSMAEQTVFLKILMQEKLDLVHFLNFNHPILYSRPFLTTVHDLTLYFFPQGKSKKSILRRAAFNYTMKHSMKAARRVIAISENTAKDAEKHLHISPAKIELIYEGGPTVSEIPFGSKTKIQDYLGTRDPYFLFVSQWRPHKGILTLIDAFGQFKKKTNLPHKLVLTGKQKVLEEEVKKALAESPYTSDIITPGFAPEELLPSLYHFSVACTVPSEYEGFGLPPLEAFAHDAPVIVANNSSLPEVVGPAGLYFPTRDVEALAKGLEQLATDEALRSSLIEKGRAQLRKFSWAKMAQQTHDLYMSILEKKR